VRFQRAAALAFAAAAAALVLIDEWRGAVGLAAVALLILLPVPPVSRLRPRRGWPPGSGWIAVGAGIMVQASFFLARDPVGIDVFGLVVGAACVVFGILSLIRSGSGSE